MKRKLIHRRTFLRGLAGGAAVGLALPPLEAMFTGRGALANPVENQPFFGLFFWANGTPWHAKHGPQQAAAGHPDLWTPSQVGPGFAPSPLLQPLMPYAPSVITGLEPHTEIPPAPGGQGDGHMRGFMVAMTGDRIRPDGFNHASHTLTALRPSLDQFVARRPEISGLRLPYRSVETGVSQARFHGYGHWNGISYNGPDSINLPIMEAGQLYDRLFGQPIDNSAARRRSLLLDAVLDDANSLRQRLGARDRIRLEAHLDNIRSLQARIDAGAPECVDPGRPNESGELREQTRLMARLMATAVDCGLTRTFSFMLTSPATTHVFNNLGVPDGMHKTCHDGHWERVRAITEYQMQAFADFLSEFEIGRPDGSTLLDHGCIYGTSEYGEGWQHSVKELPVVMVGRAGGRLRSGVHVRQEGGNLARAQLTAMQALGLDVEQFGWNGAQTRDPFAELLA